MDASTIGRVSFFDFLLRGDRSIVERELFRERCARATPKGTSGSDISRPAIRCDDVQRRPAS
jgi:hypothetical protein